MSRLDEIETRVAAATAGPWHPDPYGNGMTPCPRPSCEGALHLQAIAGPGDTEVVRVGWVEEDAVVSLSAADLALILAAREDIPYLLAEVRRLQALADVPPLSDGDYLRHAGYIHAAAMVHPDDCLTTPEKIAEGLKTNDAIRAGLQRLKDTR